MNVYLVLMWDYNVLLTCSVDSVFLSKAMAERKSKKLNDENNNPMESDEHGGFGGVKYTVQERKLEG